MCYKNIQVYENNPSYQLTNKIRCTNMLTNNSILRHFKGDSQIQYTLRIWVYAIGDMLGLRLFRWVYGELARVFSTQRKGECLVAMDLRAARVRDKSI